MEKTQDAISFKKIILILGFFTVIFFLLFIVTFFIKKGGNSGLNAIPTPTLVPLQIEKRLAPQKLPLNQIQAPPSITSNTLGKITFSIPKTNLPTTGNVYTISPSSIPINTISNLQANLLPGGNEQTINTPKGQVINMTGNNKTLTFYLYSRTIIYTNYTTTTGKAFPIDQLILKTKDFLKSIGLPVVDPSPNVSFFISKTGDLTGTDNFNSADIIDVSYNESMTGLAVFHQFGSDTRTHVWILKNGDITKLTYLYPPTYVPRNTLNLLTLSEAENAISQGQGVIVQYGKDYQQTPLQSPSSTIFTSITPGFFNDDADSALYPIFVLKGTATTNGLSYPITVYLSAEK